MMGGGCGLKGELALTDDQYEKMYNLRNDFLDRVGPKMVEAHALERHLRDVLTSSNIDTKKAGDIKSKLAATKSDLAEAKADMEIQMAQILTADQRKHLRLAMAKCPMMGGWGHRPMHHPHGGWGGRSHHGHDHGPEHGPDAK
jgi:Spy/CpxP family protein refolding chaperone